eukprot:5290437-Prymnesium_polylepis.1
MYDGEQSCSRRVPPLPSGPLITRERMARASLRRASTYLREQGRAPHTHATVSKQARGNGCPWQGSNMASQARAAQRACGAAH